MTLPFLALLLLNANGSDMVDVKSVIPTIHIELRYATNRNGAKHAIYPSSCRCMLRRAVALRLKRVQDRLRKCGLRIKIWDAYRPQYAQKALWRAYPNKHFVAPPSRGSKHSRGAAVDITLVDAEGRELKMPSDFDTFLPKAHPTYRGGTLEERTNRDILRKVMMKEGFIPDKGEWWHFNAPDWKTYPLSDMPIGKK